LRKEKGRVWSPFERLLVWIDRRRNELRREETRREEEEFFVKTFLQILREKFEEGEGKSLESI
jgi:hypothetical protein